MPEKLKVILFDHDDTLVGTKDAKWAHHKYVAKTFYGKELTDEDIIPHWGKPLPELVCLLYGTDDAKQALDNNTSCHEDFPKTLFPGTIPILQQLHDRGLLLGVITATTRFSLDHDLRTLGIPAELLNYIQTAEDTAFHKPDPRVFDPALKWLTEHKVNPDEVLYVADGLHDMKAALGVGFRFLGVETGLVTAAQFTDQGAQSLPNISYLAQALPLPK